MYTQSAFSLSGWIDEHRHLLKPPVGNKLVFENADFIVMIVGGPNQRKDYHVNPTEEFFHQIEGDMVLKIIDDGQKRDIPIKQGDIYLLPANVPHSPQRPANTVGMVVERQRPQGQHDHVRWYCEQCDEILNDVDFQLVNLGTQLKPVIEEFYGSEPLRTCKKCSTVMAVPGK